MQPRGNLSPRSCPACFKKLKPESFSFDDDSSMICGFCGGIVFSTKEKRVSHQPQRESKQFNPKKPM